MEIVVTHLTRMQPGYICVAGIEPASGEHVRPVLESRLSTRLLAAEGGPFRIGAVVDLGAARPVGHPPEVEDYRFDPWKARRVRDVAPDAFWRLLEGAARPRLAALFGPDLQQRGASCTLDAGHGRASLGCLAVSRPELVHDDERIRMRLHDGQFRVSVSVADLRLYQPDHLRPRGTVVAALAARLAAGTPVLLSVGFSRPFLKPGDTASRHWLQVNNIHLADDPLGSQWIA